MKIPPVSNINKEAWLSVFAVVFLGAVFAVPYVGRGALNVPYPTGTPRCYFFEPYGGVYHFLKYPQPASYEGTVTIDAFGKKGDAPPVTAFDLKWAAVKDSDTVAYKFDFLNSNEYIAVLSAPAAGSIPAIRNVQVPLTGSYNTRLGGTSIKYTLELKKKSDGATGPAVATCSANATLNVRWLEDNSAPTGENVSFPAGESSYSVGTSKGPAAASFKFAPPISGAIFNQQNITTYIGNRFKSIVWIPSGYPGGAGPAGRWDISDPWNPKDGGIAGLAKGGSALAVGTQPAAHRGPFHTGAYPHPPNLGFGGGAMGELANGQGRFVFDFGADCSVTDCRTITPVLSLAPGQGMAIGQLLQEPIFGGVSVHGSETEKEGRTVVDATASGKFFIYSGGGSRGDGYNQQPRSLEIFDATNLTGAVSYGSYSLKPFSSEPWPNITELQVVEVPGIRNHFLIARSGGKSITEKPLFYIGEINADTGSIIRQNSFTLDIQGLSYGAPYSPGPRVFAGSGLESASVNGKTYLFMNEKATRTSYSGSALFTLKIAAYQFDPQGLSFVRKGDITLKNTPPRPLGGNAGWDVHFRIARTENGDAYPMLAAWSKYKEPILLKNTVINNNPTSITTPQLYSIDLYGLKEILDSQAPLSTAPSVADVSIPEEEFIRPLSPGQVEVSHLGFDLSSISGGSSHHLFLKNESGKTNLYLYREAFVFDGRAYGGSGGIYDTVHATPAAGGDTGHSYRPFTGLTTLRVDRIDVSGFTGGSFTPAPIPFPTPTCPGGNCGGTGTTTVTLPPLANPRPTCSAQYSYLCDQIDNLKKSICAILPSSAFCAAQ